MIDPDTISTLGWVILGSAAFIIGFSKTGLPGSGILAVPLIASVLGGRQSVGSALPLLILGDCFAVYFYRKQARFDHLLKLLPWVLGGFLIGCLALYQLGHLHLKADPLNPIIGVIVLLMLGLSQLRGSLGDKLVPTSPAGTGATGILAGFTTMVSNAAGPIMQIYLVATKMPKEELMGTSSLYFFTVNCLKVPFYLWLSVDNPGQTLWSPQSLTAVACVVPVLLMGAVLGKRLLPVIPQKVFTQIVLVLAAIGAVKLIFS